MTAPETHQFQAETKRLLDIVVNSLYTNKDIFLRELVSNASDAIDRLRFEALTNPELVASDEEFEIRIEVDSASRSLTIRDNGIGMNRDEVISNIGTIARSGTSDVRELARASSNPDAVAEMIGQFGVGFYSAFMVADRVTLVTRRAGEVEATRWESTGDGQFTISGEQMGDRGTAITLHLKPTDHELGILDYTDPVVLTRIAERYSDFIAYPILLVADQTREGTAPEPKRLNSMKPLWTRPQSDVTDEEYAEFYKHLAHDWTEPLETIALKAEGRIEYRTLLFIPSRAPFGLFHNIEDFGLRLYARGVLVVERCQDLLPRYLRFVKGVVDSADLPLNISRQTLQQDMHIVQIRKWITRKVLEGLRGMLDSDRARFEKFWREFGAVLKEGIGVDSDNRDRILDLLVFESTNSPEGLSTLAEYVARMPANQDEIFYIAGDARRIVEKSPHLEAVLSRDFEVLFLVDPVDEFMLQYVSDYDGKRLRSIAKGDISFDDGETSKVEEREEKYRELLSAIKESLSDRVTDVRLTNRLTTSPSCLVTPEGDLSPHIERLLRHSGGDAPALRRILELNPESDLVEKLRERFTQTDSDAPVREYAELLYGLALLAEGSELPDTTQFNGLVVDLMRRGL